MDTSFALEQGWIESATNGEMLFVATHDCDLQSCGDGAEFIELVRAKPIEKIAGTNGAGQHPRILHIEEAIPEGTGFISLDQTHKLVVSKVKLLESQPSLTLCEPNRRVFSRWLASRYSRAALPDSFERRIKHARTLAPEKLDKPHPEKAKKERNLAKALLATFARLGTPIEGIYISLAGNEGLELAPSDPYTLTLVVVALVKTGTLPEDQLLDAEAVATVVRGLFEYASWDKDTGIVHLRACIPSTEQDFSLYQQRRMLKWNLDWLSVEE